MGIPADNRLDLQAASIYHDADAGQMPQIACAY